MDGMQGYGRRPRRPTRVRRRRRCGEQMGFRPPDTQWVQEVKNIQLNALNVYLVDLRENRKLRSNERVCNADSW
jgi:hypothetical protein